MPKIKINYTAAQLADIAQQKQANKLINRAKRKELKNQISQSGWKKFEGEFLPEQARFYKSKYSHTPEGQNIFEYSGHWIIGKTFYKGDNPETATEWIVTTDNGGFYKVGAEYMLWQFPSGGAQALWSNASLKKSLKSLLTNGTTVADPDYQT
jgi:hypothetical protein